MNYSSQKLTNNVKGNVTVILKLSDYNEKILQLLNDNSTYKKINYNPLKLMKKDTCKLLESWRVKGFLGKNVTKKDISKGFPNRGDMILNVPIGLI